MKKLIILVSAVFGMLNLKAQVAEIPYVEATEEAEMKVVPNEIYLQIILQENQEGRKSLSITEQESRLKNSLKSLGIAATDLTLLDANAELSNINFWGKKDVIDSKRYSLRITKTDLIGKVYAELSKLQIKSASIYKTEITFKDSIYQLLRAKAALKAKKKAMVLATALGEQLGKPMIIREENAFVILNDNASMSFRGFAKAEDDVINESPEQTVGLNAQTLKVNVYIKFSLK